MPAEVAHRRLPSSYFQLIDQFPLTHIRDAGHLGEALAVLDGLLATRLDEGGQAYLGALTDLVEVYEDKEVGIPDAAPADVLRLLIEASGLNQTEFARAVRISQSTISAIVSGSRPMTLDHVVKFASYFKVRPAAFIQVDGR